MGCCNSRPFEDGDQPAGQAASPLRTEHQTSSTRAIARSAAPPSTSAQGITHSMRQPSLATTTSTPRGSTAARDLAEQPNAPLKETAPWTSKKRTWTTSQLARERYEFFETRVTGNPEIWAALRTVTELMRDGDIATAQEILTAAGINLPSGDLIGGSWDAQGNLYRIPPEILRNPENVINDGDKIKSPLDDAKEAAIDIENKELHDFDDVAGDEKGKTLERDTINVKCRLSDRGGPDIVVTLGKAQSVALLSRRIASSGGIASTHRVRVAYLGKILQDSETLDAQGWQEGHVVNALILPSAETAKGAARKGGG